MWTQTATDLNKVYSALDLGKFSTQELNVLQKMSETLASLDLMNEPELRSLMICCMMIRYRRTETSSSRLYYGQYERNKDG